MGCSSDRIPMWKTCRALPVGGCPKLCPMCVVWTTSSARAQKLGLGVKPQSHCLAIQSAHQSGGRICLGAADESVPATSWVCSSQRTWPGGAMAAPFQRPGAWVGPSQERRPRQSCCCRMAMNACCRKPKHLSVAFSRRRSRETGCGRLQARCCAARKKRRCDSWRMKWRHMHLQRIPMGVCCSGTSSSDLWMAS